MSMRVDVVVPRELAEDDFVRWRAMQDDNPALKSAYFAPEFTVAVAEARDDDDVRVAILEDDAGHVAGYWPFQRGRLGTALPVGGLLSDHHGVVARPGVTFQWRELLDAAGCAVLRFDHLVSGQAEDVDAVRFTASPALDVSRGFQEYRERKSREGRSLTELERKARKLAREVGPVRFEAHVDDDGVLSRVLAWKSEQCRRTGVRDFFALRWTRAVVERIRAARRPRFSGVLSALYAGDALVAAHFGMTSSRAWHWWFPVYDRAYAKYSPGALLLLRVAEAAGERGVDVLDLGKGGDGYKESFADTSIPIAEGYVTTASALGLAHRAATGAETMWRASATFEGARRAVRALRKLRADAARAS